MKRIAPLLTVAFSCLILAAGTASASSIVIVDTFGPGNTFETGLGQNFSIVGSIPLLTFAPAVQFVTEAQSGLSEISVAVGTPLLALGSTASFDISLLTDVDGKPGSVLETWDNLSPTSKYNTGTSIVTVEDTLGIWLDANTAYWLQISPAVSGNLLGGTSVKWNFNDQGIDLNVTAGGPLGLVGSSLAPAFEITGATPEPASLALTGIGSALIGLAALLRKFRK